MPTIYCFVGEKGGVGKSEVALAAADYCIKKNEKVIVCEADRSNNDVGPLLEDKPGYIVIYPYFSEDANQSSQADELLDKVIEENVAAVVSCPAQTQRAMYKWLSQGSADIAMEEEGVKIEFWFVTNGLEISMRLFIESLNAFPTIPHVLVRNLFYTNPLTYDYSDPDKNEGLATLLKEHNVPVVEFPEFLTTDLEYRRANKLNFLALIEKRPGRAIAERSRIRKLLNFFYSQIEKLEVINGKQSSVADTRVELTGKKAQPKSTSSPAGRKKRSGKSENSGNSSKD